MGTATERPVDYEQVILGWMLGAVGHRELDFGIGEPLLQREGELVESWPGGEPGGIPG
jgi:hypothetical protein